MNNKNKEKKKKERFGGVFPRAQQTRHSHNGSAENQNCLDAVQLNRLEKSFRDWVGSKSQVKVQLSRKRILLIFLLIRYTGAKLNEVLTLSPFQDIDYGKHLVIFGRQDASPDRLPREVQISEPLSLEMRTMLDDPVFKRSLKHLFRVDPGHVRRKFYERAEACGFPKRLGAPDVIRKSRAVELLQDNMPLTVVQRIMGHSTPNLTSSLVSFTDEDIQQVSRFYVERESRRKTSARNTFFGKIRSIQKGDIQTKVEMITLGGDLITTLITNESLDRLGLKQGKLISAEIKAPLVVLQQTDEEPKSTAENRFQGIICRINRGRIIAEFVVRMGDGTEICALVSSEIGRRLGLKEADPVWATFNSFSVVLHVD